MPTPTDDLPARLRHAAAQFLAFDSGADAQAIRDAAAAIERQAENQVLRLPEDPPPGLLMSMAIRYDHGLGMPGYYDRVASLCGFGQPTHAQQLESTLRMMRQLYEEVAGHGFYDPSREAEYAALKDHP